MSRTTGPAIDRTRVAGAMATATRRTGGLHNLRTRRIGARGRRRIPAVTAA